VAVLTRGATISYQKTALGELAAHARVMHEERESHQKCSHSHNAIYFSVLYPSLRVEESRKKGEKRKLKRLQVVK